MFHVGIVPRGTFLIGSDKMANQIGMASIDENGNITGGQAGDQTGKEVFLRTWYSHPWTKIVRPNSADVGRKIAQLCIQGCENDKIGYDQYQRNTLLTQAKKTGFDLSAITTACECDCSSFAAVCAEGAGLTVKYTNGNAPTSGTIANSISGCSVLTASKYLTSGNYLLAGDILVASGHVAICIANGADAENPPESDDYKIWNLLLDVLGNEYGVAGVMGNLYAESGLHSDRVQGDNPYSSYSVEYTAKVDNGTISENDFVNNGPHGGGYGLAQWTYYTRKQALFNLKKSRGCSIADITMQIDFLYQELQSGYGSTLDVLTTATTVRMASDKFLFDFERPADQSEAVQIKRAKYGQKYYDLYANGGGGDGGGGGGGDGGGGDGGGGDGDGGWQPPPDVDVDDWDYIWDILGIDWDYDFTTLDDCYSFNMDSLNWEKITLNGYDTSFNPINGNSIYDIIVKDTVYKVQQLSKDRVKFLKSLELKDRILMLFSFNHNKRQIGYNFTHSRLTFTTLSYKINSVEKNGFLELQHENEKICNYINPQFVKIDSVYMNKKHDTLQTLLDEKIQRIKDEINRRLDDIIERLEREEAEKEEAEKNESEGLT